MQIEFSVLAEHLDNLAEKLAPVVSNMPVILALKATSDALEEADARLEFQADVISASAEAVQQLTKLLDEKDKKITALSNAAKATPLTTKSIAEIKENYSNRYSLNTPGMNWYIQGWRAAEQAHKIQFISR